MDIVNVTKAPYEELEQPHGALRRDGDYTDDDDDD